MAGRVAPAVDLPVDTDWLTIVAQIFRDDELNVSTDDLAHYVRLRGILPRKKN